MTATCWLHWVVTRSTRAHQSWLLRTWQPACPSKPATSYLDNCDYIILYRHILTISHFFGNSQNIPVGIKEVASNSHLAAEFDLPMRTTATTACDLDSKPSWPLLDGEGPNVELPDPQFRGMTSPSHIFYDFLHQIGYLRCYLMQFVCHLCIPYCPTPCAVNLFSTHPTLSQEFNVSGAAVSLYPCGPPNPSAWPGRKQGVWIISKSFQNHFNKHFLDVHWNMRNSFHDVYLYIYI